MTTGPAKTDTCVDCVCLTGSHDMNGCAGDGNLPCPTACTNLADFQEPYAVACEVCLQHFSVADTMDMVVVAIDEGAPVLGYKHRRCDFEMWEPIE